MKGCIKVGDAQRSVRDALKRVNGLADVIIFGERKYSMRLWLDPDRLAARGLTAADVVGALSDQNVQVAAGQVGQPPARRDQSYQISVRAVGRMARGSSSSGRWSVASDQ